MTRVTQPTGEDLGPCPWCGERIAADVELSTAFHALPTCDQFDALDALAFVTEVRRALQMRTCTCGHHFGLRAQGHATWCASKARMEAS